METTAPASAHADALRLAPAARPAGSDVAQPEPPRAPAAPHSATAPWQHSENQSGGTPRAGSPTLVPYLSGCTIIPEERIAPSSPAPSRAARSAARAAGAAAASQ